MQFIDFPTDDEINLLIRTAVALSNGNGRTPEQQQNFAIPVKITDEIANLSTMKGGLSQKMSYILCTLFSNQREGTICASVPWYTPIESKITHKADLSVHVTYKAWIVIN